MGLIEYDDINLQRSPEIEIIFYHALLSVGGLKFQEDAKEERSRSDNAHWPVSMYHGLKAWQAEKRYEISRSYVNEMLDGEDDLSRALTLRFLDQVENMGSEIPPEILEKMARLPRTDMGGLAELTREYLAGPGY